jgi:outer membrane protein assembly factor BamB
MSRDNFVVRVGSALLVAGLVVSTVVFGGDSGVPAADAKKVDLSGDGCSTRMAVGSDGAVVNEVGEPIPQHAAAAWSVRDAGGFDVGAVAGTNDVVYVGAGTAVSALTLADGTSLWRRDLDVGDLRKQGESGIELAVGDVLAVAYTESTTVVGDEGPWFDERTVVAALDPATGAQRWLSEVFKRGPTEVPTPLEVFDDLVVVEVFDGSVETVRAFDATTGSLRWQADGRLAGGGNGTVFINRQDQCLVHAVDAAHGGEKWSLPTSLQGDYDEVTAQVASDGDGVVIIWTPNLSWDDNIHGLVVNAPVVVARVDASTGADLWRFHLPAEDIVAADADIDTPSWHVAITHSSMTTLRASTDVFELDPDSGVARWAVQIPLSGVASDDQDEIFAEYPFTQDTELAVVPATSMIRVSTGTELYMLSLGRDGRTDARRRRDRGRAIRGPRAGDDHEINHPPGRYRRHRIRHRRLHPVIPKAHTHRVVSIEIVSVHEGTISSPGVRLVARRHPSFVPDAPLIWGVERATEPPLDRDRVSTHCREYLGPSCTERRLGRFPAQGLHLPLTRQNAQSVRPQE